MALKPRSANAGSEFWTNARVCGERLMILARRGRTRLISLYERREASVATGTGSG